MFGGAELSPALSQRKNLRIDPYNSGFNGFVRWSDIRELAFEAGNMERPSSSSGPPREAVQIIGGWETHGDKSECGTGRKLYRVARYELWLVKSPQPPQRIFPRLPRETCAYLIVTENAAAAKSSQMGHPFSTGLKKVNS
jgi:hypothetical protein